MTKIVRNPFYRRYRFPAAVIATTVMLCFRFLLSLQIIEDMLV